MGKTVTKERGKADRVADGPNTSQPVAEGTGEQQLHRPGHVNGQPVDDVDATTVGSNEDR